jgi:hypothetical protein
MRIEGASEHLPPVQNGSQTGRDNRLNYLVVAAAPCTYGVQ